MKKLLLMIILSSSLFSSIFYVSAKEGYIENMLNLQHIPEQTQYNLSKLPERTFKNNEVQKKYNELKRINDILINEFYDKYKKSEIDYYSAKGIAIHHKVFIYHSSKLFEYLSLQSQNKQYYNMQDNIIESYSQMRSSFNRIKFLYARNNYNYSKDMYRKHYGY